MKGEGGDGRLLISNLGGVCRDVRAVRKDLAEVTGLYERVGKVRKKIL